MRVCSYLLWQNQMFQRTFAFRNAELICLFVRACKCWQQTTRKITGIRSNLLTFQNLSCLLLLRLARGEQEMLVSGSWPSVKSHTAPEGSAWCWDSSHRSSHVSSRENLIQSLAHTTRSHLPSWHTFDLTVCLINDITSCYFITLAAAMTIITAFTVNGMSLHTATHETWAWGLSGCCTVTKHL